MQGVVTDERGAYVKAVIVNLIKAKDSEDGSGAVDVTYAETDEEGRFVIQDMSPDEKYIIEIHVEVPEAVIKSKEADGKEAVTESEVAAEPELKFSAVMAEPEHTAVKEPEPEAVTEIESEVITELKIEIVTEPKHEAVTKPEPVAYDPDLEDEEDLDLYEEEDAFEGDLVFIDSLDRNNMIVDTIRENISFGNLYDPQGFNLKDKQYLIKNNLW